MIRFTGFLFAALLLAVFASAGAQAQSKKKNPACVPNFHEACMKRCIGAGGRPTGCGTYCQNRKVELGCP